ncbi:homocysteine-responsive endoplasmic reticulum-resident ubiquitin-like domain member 2 protein [Corythoichthys intestinalis]|uniref:homocysteine-responsive endoplasmic reticulum-resident ubiquitin-like domain member 2 protein n=1 Tax=Corythoichthys intestinalis TaxID=161448 RepID=UPI0025A60041|nr:homocysteine-responsive endoplasmic reticulum-resident ubiquitin-like domain member 2 protein [Corythoichthys intestinalis]XP_061789446.1 homocysteine-responsive endoplasmic reticulum-resident ubiquitin-like domain member 2 protein [Nerophis lumbriciformis]
MESGEADTSVTLIIKAPDQKYEDCTINCFLSWTVEKLKSHIAKVYPSQPCSRDQRLVYLGKLLQDHLQLRDVLRQDYQQDEYHMLHLVCNSRPPSSSPSPPSNSSLNSPEISSSALLDGPTIPGGPSGLRNRGGPFNVNLQSPVGTSLLPHGEAQLLLQGGQMTPMQMWWWQQMYMQHYYMQYQAAVAASQLGSSFDLSSSQPPPGPNEAVQPLPAVAPLPENLPPADADIQMNAQGGMLNGDELDHDWLEWLYTLFRVSVLLSFVFIYSSFGRFMVVLGAMMLVYMYQVGWIPLRTPEERRPNFPNPEQAQAWEEAEMQRGIQELERVMDDGTEDAGQDPPGSLTTAWSFIRAFFTSLVPEGDPQRPPEVPPILRPR